MCNAMYETMWQNDVSFCPQLDNLSTDSIADKIAGMFSASKAFTALLRQRYVKMSELFRNTCHFDAAWEQNIGCEICRTIPCHCKPDARLAVPTRHIGSTDDCITAMYDNPNFGLDLPVWFHTGNGLNASRIMIIAQDPLRTDPQGGNLYISSPWAFHSHDFRISEKKAVSSLLVNSLLEQGRCVYLTDSSKIFSCNHGYAREYIDPNFGETFRNVLSWEIEHFNPDAILVVGEPASAKVLQMGGEERFGQWSDAVIPRPCIRSLALAGRMIPCVFAYHFTRISSRKRDLEGTYNLADADGNANYVQYYGQAIESALASLNA